MNSLLKTMADHRSVRAFLPDPVPAATVRQAVAAAQMASTSSWIQAYSLLQVTDPGDREQLADLCGGQAQVHEAGAFFAVLADTRRHRLIAEREGASYHGNLETFLLAVVDASLFAQNLALAFESTGLGICFIGGLRRRLPQVDTLLGLPEGVWPLFGLCVGTPVERGEVRPRVPVDAALYQDRYPTDAEILKGVDAADVTAAEHYSSRGLEGRNWSGGIWRRFQEPARDDLAEYYKSKGACLD